MEVGENWGSGRSNVELAVGEIDVGIGAARLGVCQSWEPRVGVGRGMLDGRERWE